MRKWQQANTYVLSVCILISEYVRQQQQDAKQSNSGEDSVASLVDAPHAPSPPATISRSSLNALARFLSFEIQAADCTTLHNLLRRLEIKFRREQDFELLSWQLVSILTSIESPDAVWNTVEQIAECVAPLEASREEEGADADMDSADSTLARTSLLGVFVRSFLLAVNRMLFDGLSRLFDDVKQYLEQFREDVEKEKKREKTRLQQEEKDSSLEIVGSPTSQHLHLWEEKQQDNELQLSPIQTGNATPLRSAPPDSLMTPAPMRLDSQVLVEKLVTLEAAREVNDPAVWSTDQLNYALSDMAREMEGGRSSRQRAAPSLTQAEGKTIEEQLRLLRKMDGSNPNVLFVRYLSFLHDRDYQGALDSLHQYHDVLSPRQDPRPNSSSGSDGNVPVSSGSAGSAGSQFRGSGMQYAALNLAGLQIVFDHYNAAQESIQEAIRVAHHHGDHVCVAFALAWLIRISQKTGKSKEGVLQLVSSCLDRALELRIPSLQVLATLTEVESKLTRGSTGGLEAVGSTSQFVPHIFAAHAPAPRPLHIWSRLNDTMQSIALLATPATSISNNGTRAMNALQAQVNSGADVSLRPGGSGMEWLKSTEAILDTVRKLSGKVTISTAISWSLFGQRSLEKVFNRMCLSCYEDSASTGEIALTVSQLAMSNLAENEDGGIVYVRALEFLVGIVADNSVRNHHLLHDASFQKSLHQLFFLWAVQRGEFARAEVHLNVILALSPEGKDFPAYLEALMLQAELWIAMGDYPQSLHLLERLEATCSKHGFAYLHTQVLILASRTRIQAAAPHAPFTPLNDLLKCVDICKSHHFDLLLAEAHVVLAEVYIAMGKLQDAYSIINDQMPMVIEHGGIDLRGECLLILAKTTIASIKWSKEPARAASKAIELLNASAEMFTLVQNLRRLKEVNYVKSLVYNHVVLQLQQCGGDATSSITQREQAAAKFLKHEAQLKQGAFRSIEPFFDLESADTIRQVITHRSSEL